MTRTRFAAAFALALLWISSASALEIPLGSSVQASGGNHGTAVGFVDMDRIFQIYPQTNNAKEDYAKQLQKKRDQLADKETKVNNIKNRISVLEATMKDLGAAAAAQPANPDGTTTAPAADAPTPQNLTDMKRQLETEMAELDDMRKQSEKDLATFQGQQSQIILGKIYESLRDLAQEEQITVVVDKASILYGDTAIDLTDKLQAKVRGY